MEASPQLKEEWKWSMPNYTDHGNICYLQTAKQHVNLGFHKGNILEEMAPNNVLQGTGKTMRQIRIKQREDIQPEVITDLIKKTIILNGK